MTPLSPRPPSARRHLNRWILIAVILILLIAMLAGARWGYRKIRIIRARHLDALAAEYLRAGKLKEAQMSVQSALSLYPSDPGALRLQVHLQQLRGEDGAALQALQALDHSGKLTLDDLRPYAVLAQRQGDTKLADLLAEAAGKKAPLQGYLIRADLLMMRQKPEKAVVELRMALDQIQDAKAEALDEVRLDLLNLLMTRGALNPASRKGSSEKNSAEAYGLLKDLGSRTTAAGAKALATGLGSGLIPEADRAEWIQKLRDHPEVTPEMLLLADSASIDHDSSDKARVVDAMIQRMKPLPLDQRLAAVRWLLMQREPAKAIDLISRDEALRSQVAFMLWMQARQQTGRYDEILEALALPSIPIAPHLRDLYRAASLKDRRQTAEANEAFRKALNDYEGRRPECYDVIVFLNMAGEQQLFDQGFRKMLSDPSTAEPMLQAIVPPLRKMRDSAKLLSIYEVAAASPSLKDNSGVQNELAYLKLVMNQQVDPRQLAARVEETPAEFPFRVTQALALLKSGNKAKALEVLNSVRADVDTSKMPPQQLMILAVALAVNGDQEKAFALLSQIPTDQLSLQESALLRASIPPPQGAKLQQPAPTPDPLNPTAQPHGDK